MDESGRVAPVAVAVKKVVLRLEHCPLACSTVAHLLKPKKHKWQRFRLQERRRSSHYVLRNPFLCDIVA